MSQDKKTTPDAPEVENKPIIVISNYNIEAPFNESDIGKITISFAFLQNYMEPENYSKFIHELEEFLKSKYR